MSDDPDHPIIGEPWNYSVIGFNYQVDDDGSSRIDLTLMCGDDVRRLRFANPQDIELEAGFPACPGIVIKDVSARQLDHIRVRVADFEGASHGAMRFWAESVFELDDVD